MALTAAQLDELKARVPESEREGITAENVTAKCDERLLAFSALPTEVLPDILEFSGTTPGAIKGWISRRGGAGSFQADHATNYAEGAGQAAGNAVEHGHAANLHAYAAHLHEKAAATAKDEQTKNYHKEAQAHHEKQAAHHTKQVEKYSPSGEQPPKAHLVQTKMAASLEPDVSAMLREGTTERLDGLVQAAKIAPADRDAWALALTGTEENPDCLMLSREEGAKKSRARVILDLLVHNKPVVELGGKTKIQKVAMSREPPDDSPDKVEIEKVQKEMAAKAGGK